MLTGYIKLYRKSLESIIFTSEKGWKIWTWCLLKANHENNIFFLNRTKITLKAGQFIMGKNTASNELGMAVGTIWYWLSLLEKEGNIERKSTNKYTIITIIKWKEYQTIERRLNADRTQIEQQIEPNKNDKNVKNDKNNITSKEVIGRNKVSTGMPEINQLITFLKTSLNGSLDGTIVSNRRFCYLLLNKIKKDYPAENNVSFIQQVISKALKDNFHAKNATNFRYFYYNMQKIIQSDRQQIMLDKIELPDYAKQFQKQLNKKI